MTTELTPSQLQAITEFRANRETSLRREYGWLSLAGLFWLDEGEDTMGSAAGNSIRLPERGPAQAGVFLLRNGQVTLTPNAGANIRLGEIPLTGTSAPLKVDTSGEPDFIFIENPSAPIRMMVIERAGQLAIRVWDPESPVRSGFPGCAWYEMYARFRLMAQVETYAEPKHFMIDDIVGIQRPVSMHAALAFQLNGNEYRLDGEKQEDGSFDLIFKDATASKTTYGAGRYLTTEVTEGDHVVIDFNVAYNPPCAFTAFATCPLPLPQNILPVAIEAGEKSIE
jgi:uncharacterized protein (DUF1684 family)